VTFPFFFGDSFPICSTFFFPLPFRPLPFNMSLPLKLLHRDLSWFLPPLLIKSFSYFALLCVPHRLGPIALLVLILRKSTCGLQETRFPVFGSTFSPLCVVPPRAGRCSAPSRPRKRSDVFLPLTWNPVLVSLFQPFWLLSHTFRFCTRNRCSGHRPFASRPPVYYAPPSFIFSFFLPFFCLRH